MNISPSCRGKKWSRGWEKPSVRDPKLRRQKKWAKRYLSYSGIPIVRVVGRVIVIDHPKILCMGWYSFTILSMRHKNFANIISRMEPDHG